MSEPKPLSDDIVTDVLNTVSVEMPSSASSLGHHISALNSEIDNLRASEAEKDKIIRELVKALSFLMLHGDKHDGHDVYCACPAQTDRAGAVHSTACAEGIMALRSAGALP